MADQDVYLIKKISGVSNCPDGKLCLFTNVDYNKKVGDILVISPNIQVDQAQLESYGFILGAGGGVSSVVNNMNQAATLVSGIYLDGQTLSVSAGQDVSTLYDYPLGSSTWNDAVRSVVSAPVTEVNLLILAESDFSVGIDERYLFKCKIENNSATTVEDVTINVTISNADIISVSAVPAVTVPANSSVILRIPVTGKAVGSTELVCRLHAPIGVINTGNNVVTTLVHVTEPKPLQVTQQLMSHWKLVWDQPEYIYSYHLILTSRDEQVSSWELSFVLPEGAEVSPDWLKTNVNWIILNIEKSVEGHVYLESRAGHIIGPNQDVPLDIQIIYPGESTDYNVINNLRLEQLS